jgi:hypothetical protein
MILRWIGQDRLLLQLECSFKQAMKIIMAITCILKGGDN